ncbi:MAG: SpoIVB peptidase [Lachnospiraceae bacterium]|nr:SpoIVB peptidase [Lachnospiraceae bacterium]
MSKKTKRVYKAILVMAIVLDIGLISVLMNQYVDSQIPDKIKLIAGQEEGFVFDLPATIQFSEESIEVISSKVESFGGGESEKVSNKVISAKDGKKGKYTADIKMFGLFKIKSVDVEVIEEQRLMPLGIPVGIYIETNGLLVLGAGEIKDEYGMTCNPAQNIIKGGDYIVEVEGKTVTTKKAMMDIIKNTDKEDISLKIRRGEGYINVKIPKVRTLDGEYKLGVWVRSDMQGIGTMTYVNDKGGFAALGHGINDIDTNVLMNIDYGSLYTSNISQIVKGLDGAPGQMVGSINYENECKMGRIEENNENGIYGHVEKNAINRLMSGEIIENHGSNAMEYMEIGLKQNIKKGKAVIISAADGTLREYEVEIEHVNINDDGNKGMVLKVTDEDLIGITGGIVKGMFTSYNGSNNRKARKIKGFLMF